MSIEIAILYEDLVVVRMPWDKKEILARDGVIAISIINSLAVKRQCSIQHDLYQLIWTDTDYCLTGHDDDYGFINFKNPDLIDWRFPFIMPENSMEFEGEIIPGDQYSKAKLIYADPDGGMF